MSWFSAWVLLSIFQLDPEGNTQHIANGTYMWSMYIVNQKSLSTILHYDCNWYFAKRISSVERSERCGDFGCQNDCVVHLTRVYMWRSATFWVGTYVANPIYTAILTFIYKFTKVCAPSGDIHVQRISLDSQFLEPKLLRVEKFFRIAIIPGLLGKWHSGKFIVCSYPM